ncbi:MULTISPECIES: transcriptional regulator [Sinobaca]|uniref:Putative transcriptional regulator YheO n=1 Tax=Sinobaca qinghaiensis TaxID=342944 RepID=A0A419V0H9_9BACL|nr:MULTISPECIES: PAS domain-containing protein [Sinobaca]RKD71433.1 putative transcriptional regulator YheO [Sinobaca qinghaiensis]
MTNENEQHLKGYIPLAKSTAAMFGTDCEVVLHDLTNPQASVIFTVNNHVTGRETGQSFDHLVKTVLRSNDFHEDYLAGYTFYTEDQRAIRSSTTLIRNPDQKVIGAFCINFDVQALEQLQQWTSTFLPAAVEIPPDKEPSPAEMDNVEEIVDGLIQQIVKNKVYPGMKRQEKIDLIQFMEDKGIFSMKGSIDKAAALLNVSKVTIYSYLDEIKSQSN